MKQVNSFRRKVVAALCMVALWVAVLPVTVTQTGCTPNQAENEINVVLTQATNILAVAEPGASWLPDMQKAIAALKTAEAAWIGGGPVADVEAALNTIEDITAVIPLTEVYSPLIDVLVAGIEAVLAALPQPAASTSNVTVAHIANVHKGRAHVKNVKDSKAQWDAIVKANPALRAAALTPAGV